MSLFHYKVQLPDGTEKTSKITAKDEPTARKRIAALIPVQKWYWIRPAAESPPTSPPPFPKPLGSEAKAKPPTKLDRLLFLQSGKCFFCGKALARSEASIEHIQPKARGGSDSHENTVACCSRLNQVFGDLGLKEKLRLILAHSGSFRCPKEP